jgi:Flp pilus assembly secretin CpaC
MNRGAGRWPAVEVKAGPAACSTIRETIMSNPMLPLVTVFLSLATTTQLCADQTVTVAPNSTVRLQMTKAKGAASSPLIGTVQTDKTGIVEVRPAYNDQSTIIVRGIAFGITRLELTSLDGKQRETYEVIVEPDMELLNHLLRRVTPTASVKPIPIGGNGIVLTGTVRRAEDIPTILAITRTYAPGR